MDCYNPLKYGLALLLLGTLLTAVNAADTAAENPNIIFILADDLSYWDLSLFGQQQFKTPNIDRLGKEGLVFRNAYCGAAWCAPSRTSLLTGRSAAHFTPLEKDENGEWSRFNPTVAEMLKTVGYATSAIGKWHMWEPDDSWNVGNEKGRPEAENWAEQKRLTNWRQLPWNRGFDVCRIGYRAGFNGGNGNPFYPFRIETGDNEEIRYPENENLSYSYLNGAQDDKRAPKMFDDQGRFLDMSGKDSSQMRFSEDIYREEALKFIREHKDQPFYLHYATPLVHGPIAVKSLGRFKDKEEWSYRHRIWAAMIENELDQTVGAITDEVKKLGIEKRTIIIFTSDNGYAAWLYLGKDRYEDDPVFHHKGPWNGGKFITTNGGLITPFIAWGPGRVPAGKTTDRAINFYDFMATAAELSGAKLPGSTEGVSYVPLLEGRDNDQPLRNVMEWSGASCRFTPGIPDDWAKEAGAKRYRPDAILLDEKWYAIRLGDTVRLFDIFEDPGMKHDLSAENPERTARAMVEFERLENI